MVMDVEELDEFGDWEEVGEPPFDPVDDFDFEDSGDLFALDGEEFEEFEDDELGLDFVDDLELGEDFEGDELGLDFESDLYESDGFEDVELGDGLDLWDEGGGWGDHEDFEFGVEGMDEEDAEFLGKLIRGAGRLIKKGVKFLAKKIPLFRMLAPLAAKVLGTVVGGPAGAAIAGALTRAVLKESEAADESVEQIEEMLASADEEFLEAGGDLEVAEMMEQAADEAADAFTAAEANAAIGRMMRLLPRLTRDRRLRRHMRVIAKGLAALATTLHRNPRTRWAVRLIPLIARRTLLILSRKRRITRKEIVKALAQATSWVLANHRRSRGALRHRRRFIRRACVRRVRRRRVRRRPVRRF